MQMVSGDYIANKLSVSPEDIGAVIGRNFLPKHTKIGDLIRWKRDDIDEWLESLLSIEELSELLNTTSDWIENAIGGNMIPQPIRIGDCVRWEKNRIESWINSECKSSASNINYVEEPDHALSSLKEVEKNHIIKILGQVDGNRTDAARILGIGERTLYRKIKEYGI